MLLIGEKAYKALISREGFSWKDLGLDGPIKKVDFELFKDRFEKRMEQSGNKPDKGRQYFLKQSIEDVINHSDTNQVAFIYVTNSAGKQLRVALVGLNSGDKYYSGKIYLSTRTAGEIETLPDIEKLKEGSENYLKRIHNYPHNPCRDRGIIHDKAILRTWLENSVLVTGDVIRSYIGVDNKNNNPELQNVMLVDDKSFGTSRNEDEYAFDKGGGCCP